MATAEERVRHLRTRTYPVQGGHPVPGTAGRTRRVTPELLYDSAATLRLVDTAIEELHLTSQADRAGRHRIVQLHPGAEHGGGSACDYLLAYWDIQAALEILRDSRAALAPSLAPQDGLDQEHAGLSRALSLIDSLQADDEEGAPLVAQQFAHLRGEILSLAESLNEREERAYCLHHTAGLLQDLELRLAQLARSLDGGDPGAV